MQIDKKTSIAMKPLIKMAQASEFEFIKDNSDNREICYQNKSMCIYVENDAQLNIDRVYLVDEFGEYSTLVKNMTRKQKGELMEVLFPFIEIEEEEQDIETHECILSKADIIYEMRRDYINGF